MRIWAGVVFWASSRITKESARVRPLGPQQVVKGVVKRSQVGIHLLLQIAWQKAKPFARFHGRAGQDDPLNPLFL
jgi:hypothetical protein